MYKIFYDNIRNLSIVIGYLSLLRSHYSGFESHGGKDYILANRALVNFRLFCKKIIKNIEILANEQGSEVNFNVDEIKKIRKIINAISKPASQGLSQEINDSTYEIEDFIKFLKNEFPHRSIDRVDLLDIKTRINMFKHQLNI